MSAGHVGFILLSFVTFIRTLLGLFLLIFTLVNRHRALTELNHFAYRSNKRKQFVLITIFLLASNSAHTLFSFFV